jgi:hypothetical protein
MNTNTTTNQRRRLFTRLQSNLPPLEITKRDLRILELVQNYRFLNTEQIQALIGGSARNGQERLSRLFQHAYLDRPLHQLELRNDGYRFMIYALAPKGARFIASALGHLAPISRNLGENNRTAKRFHLAHTLMVSQFRECLSLACSGDANVKLAAWRVPVKSLARIRIGRFRAAIIPDASFSLERSDGQQAHFFLEADRGTMTNDRFLRKLKAYWSLSRMKGVPDIPDAFRVLTITNSRRRTESLRITAKAADTKRKGSRKFLFATQDAYDLKHPEALLEHIWRTPADPELCSLLEGTSLNRGGKRD